MPSIQKPDENFDLVDMPNEEWRDAYGYDGYYMVSNLGRIKSLKRWVQTSRHGFYTKERIMKQVNNRGMRMIKTSIDGIKIGHNVSNLVANVFIRLKEEGEVVIHKNKKPWDNRLCNLKIGTESESCLLNYKLGVSVDHGINNCHKDYISQLKREYTIVSNGITTHHICIICNIEKPVNEFRYRQKSDSYQYVCMNCHKIRRGIKAPFKRTESIELANSGLRKCHKCKDVKSLSSDFDNCKTSPLGKRYTCKKCMKEYYRHKKLG